MKFSVGLTILMRSAQSAPGESSQISEEGEE
jgi:hypothetical protein